MTEHESRGVMIYCHEYDQELAKQIIERHRRGKSALSHQVIMVDSRTPICRMSPKLDLMIMDELQALDSASCYKIRRKPKQSHKPVSYNRKPRRNW